MEHNRRVFSSLFGYISQLYNDVLLGISPIHRAILDRRGFEYIKTQLYENHKFIDYRNRDGNTPLHLVFGYEVADRYKYFELLLEAGADVDLRNDNGQSPVSLLCANPTYPLLIPVLHLMLRKANSDSVETGLYQVFMNFFHQSGCSQINIETECNLRHSNTIEAIKVLLNKGADFDVQWLKEIMEKLGGISLNGDCLKKFKSMCKLLIQNAFMKNVFKERYIDNTLNLQNVTSSDNDKQVVLLELCNFITNYVNVCKNEVGFLKNTDLHYQISIYKFIVDFWQEERSNIHYSASVAKMLLSFQQCERVRFRKFFYRSVKNLKKEDLIKVALKLRNFQEGKVAENALTSLNYDCFREICKYLSKDDLIILMTALYGVFT